MRFPNDEFYLKSEAEMREIFAAVPEAIENTNVIAEACAFDFRFGEYHLPEFVPPEGMTNRDYLRKLCHDGLIARYGDDPAQNLIERLGMSSARLRRWATWNISSLSGILSITRSKTRSWSAGGAARRQVRSSPTVWRSRTSTRSNTI